FAVIVAVPRVPHRVQQRRHGDHPPASPRLRRKRDYDSNPNECAKTLAAARERNAKCDTREDVAAASTAVCGGECEYAGSRCCHKADLERPKQILCARSERA